MDKKQTDIAISVKSVSKTFKIPHEKVTSIRGAAIGAFKKKGYEEFKALDDVSFEIKKGEFFGVIGRNGSGKSTLLKILAGIYQPDKGKVKINGRISPFLELGIGFNPELSGRDNVYLNATVLGLTKKEIDEKFDSIVQFSELERFIDQKLKNYSSGMQVRLAFSVSIHANRDILLMDEVLAVGDSNFQKKCINEFEKYKNQGKTVVLVTHDINVVKDYCDRAVLINNGEIAFIGKTSEAIMEYVKLNINYESRRINEENNKKKIQVQKNNRKENIGKSSKKAIINDFKIYNNNKIESSSLKTGEFFIIDIIVKFNEYIKNPVFGAMFGNANVSNLFGIHSLYCDNPVSINEVAPGDIYKVSLKSKMPLTPGIYNISLYCSSQESYFKYELLDNIENVAEISVSSEKNHWGIIDSTDSNIIKEKIK